MFLCLPLFCFYAPRHLKQLHRFKETDSRVWGYDTIMYIYIYMDVSKIGVPQNGWFVMGNPINMDDLGVPLFSETPTYIYIYLNMPRPSKGCQIDGGKRVAHFLVGFNAYIFRLSLRYLLERVRQPRCV